MKATKLEQLYSCKVGLNAQRNDSLTEKLVIWPDKYQIASFFRKNFFLKMNTLPLLLLKLQTLASAGTSLSKLACLKILQDYRW